MSKPYCFYYHPKPFTFTEVNKETGKIIYTKLIGYEIKRKTANWKKERDKEFKRLMELGFKAPLGEPKER